MKTLDDAWSWYEHNRRLLKMMQRLGDRYWGELPGGGRLGNDDDFRRLGGDEVGAMARGTLSELDDLAIFVIFSVFESIVRQTVVDDLQDEISSLHHPALRRSADRLLQNIQEGSFYNNVLELFKGDGKDIANQRINSLIEDVSRVRRYRNWVAHGRKESEYRDPINPRNAFDSLQAFLAHIRR